MMILVHGAYHGGWCWERAVDALAARGIAAAAPDLPGHGRDPGWLADQSMDNYAARVIEQIDAAPAPVVLVGHSLGGVTIRVAAQARPDKVRKLIYLTALIPAPGERVTDLLRADTGSHAETVKVEVEGMSALAMKAGNLAAAFYQDVDARTLAWAEDRVQLQSPEPFRYRLDADAPPLGVPAAAIVCRNDKAISAAHQRTMAVRAGCDPIIEMDCGHSPFAADPDGLAARLAELSA